MTEELTQDLTQDPITLPLTGEQATDTQADADEPANSEAPGATEQVATNLSAGAEDAQEPESEEALMLRKIKTMNAEIIQEQQELLHLKEKLETARERVKAKESEITDMLAELSELILNIDATPGPLFEQKPTEQKADSDTALDTASPAEDDSWRQDRLEDVLVAEGLSAAIVKRLEDAQILTMGDLVDWTDPARNGGYTRRITDIDGIGPTKAEKIEEATSAYWATRQRRQAEETSASAEPANSDEVPPLSQDEVEEFDNQEDSDEHGNETEF